MNKLFSNYFYNQSHKKILYFLLITFIGSVSNYSQTLKSEQIYPKVLPSIMTLKVLKQDGSHGIGSAFLAIEEGIGITAYHVIKDAIKVTAKFSDGEEFDVLGIIDKDENRDIAIIRLNKIIGRPTLDLEKIEQKIGSPLYVIGAPLGLDFSITDGLLSQIRTLEGIKYYQFSCPASPGNSGCPLLNSKGEVIGVVSWQASEGQNINFATPSLDVLGLNKSLEIQPFTSKSIDLISDNSSKINETTWVEVSPKSPTTRFNFDFDYAQFGYDSTSNYLEFYYSFDQSSMKISSSDSVKVVEGILQISIKNTNTGQRIVDKEWKVSFQVSGVGETGGKYLIGVVGFILPHGGYKCTIGGRDINNENNHKIFTGNLTSGRFITEHISISDIQLASRIIQDSPNKESIFYKNSMEIYPIPTSVFGENQPVVFYYSELYNLLPKNGSESLKIISTVYNSRGKSVYSKSKPVSRSYDSRVEVGSIVVNKFPTDTYTFVVALIDSASNYGVSSSKKFYVFNPSIALSDTATGQVSGVFASEFGVMTDEELDDHFGKSKYVATSDEIDKFEKINSTEGRREFLYNFWKDRDNDLSTSENEYYKNYFNRINISNQRYGSISRVGWKSDRGRIFILYGDPSEIERYPNQVDSKPYEIWNYNELEGGVIFVFGDLTGFSDYTLLHSTLRGELRDDNWSRRIATF